MYHSFIHWRRFSLVLALLLSAALAPRTARASHALGSDLYYTNVGPGLYLVTYRFYRDCSGITEGPTMTLNMFGVSCATSNGTSSAPAATLNRQGIEDGNPYCNYMLSTQQPCDSTRQVSTPFPNFQIWSYSGIISLPTQCSDWRLSVSVSARPSVGNLSTEGNLYSEAVLNNRDVTDDSSPRFSITNRLMPLAFMCDSTAIRYNSGVVDPDGDSLVYSLAPALNGANSPETYTSPYTYTDPVRLLPGTALQLTPDGSILLTAGANSPNNTNNNEQNKFVVVIQVDAYRRVNGQVVHTGRSRRDIAVVIIRCLGSPTGPQIPINGIMVEVPGHPDAFPATGALITALANEPLTIHVTALDLNGDSIFTTVEPASLPSGATMLTPVGAGSTTLQFDWTPTAANVRSQPYVVHFSVRDNGCPYGVRKCYTLPIQVVPQRPTGLAPDRNAPAMPAAPNPFTTEARLTIRINKSANPASAVMIYDAAGRLVDQLPVPAGSAGERQLVWRPRADLKVGLYLARYADAAGRQTVRLQKL